ncbi:cytochrome c biogenesis CcdA family protein [Sneathiella aquimaris]|jgi:cytochrome c-type biogenesis protein|uniref:cytochrome c biogenesis CcdA family protein n=1 Tax=Sneathiella aquimaris TaxID=2599305 RepID=UPI00146A28F8|nr:cytochrome c biogenesis protein CcdA [Sneathiella aquimaris]
MIEISGIGIVATFLAGIISFLSPCVLPLIPGYISYIAGSQRITVSPEFKIREKFATAALSLCFIFGFSTIFIALGASASTIGRMLIGYSYELNLVGGGIVVAFGLFMIGLVQLDVLQRDVRFHLTIPGGRSVSAYVLGLAFGFGWTPCIGPILGAVLTVSAAAATLREGVVLLMIYSAGLGVPFLLAAIFTDSLRRKIRDIGRLGRRLHLGAGVLMIVMGIMMMTGQLSKLSYWLLDVLPILGKVG